MDRSACVVVKEGRVQRSGCCAPVAAAQRRGAPATLCRWHCVREASGRVKGCSNTSWKPFVATLW